MFTNVNIQKLLIATLALQLFISCHSKPRENKKDPAKAAVTDTKTESDQAPTAQSALSPQQQTSGQSQASLNDKNSKQTSEGDKKEDNGNKEKKDENENPDSTKPTVTIDPVKKDNADQAAKNEEKEPKKQKNPSLFSPIAIDEKNCQDLGIKVIQFNDNIKTTLVIAQFYQGNSAVPLNRYLVLKVDDKNQILSSVVSDETGSQENSLLLIDGRLNIEKSSPNQVRIAVSGKDDLVGEVKQLSKEDELAKNICRKIQLNPLSILIQTEVFHLAESSKKKKLFFVGSFMSTQRILSEIKLQITKDLKASAQIGQWSQVFDFSYNDSKDVMLKINDLGHIINANNLLAFHLNKKISITKDPETVKLQKTFVKGKSSEDDTKIVIEANQEINLAIKYID